MIDLNSLSLVVGIIAGMVAIYSHIRINKMSPEQAKAYAEESIKAMYPEIDILYSDWERGHKENPTKSQFSEGKPEVYPNTKIPIRTLNKDMPEKTEIDTPDKVV